LQAITDYDRAIALQPDYADALLGRGLALEKAGQPDRAIEDFNQFAALRPSDARAFKGRGDAYRDKGECARAIQDYDRALSLRPGDTETIAKRGLAVQAGNPVQSTGQPVAALNPLMTPNPFKPPTVAGWPSPNSAFSLYHQGSVYLNAKDYDNAVTTLDKAIDLDPKSVVGFNARGLAREGKGQHDEAIADYDRALALNPKYAAALINRANAYRGKGRDDQAIADLDRAIAMEPKNFLAHFARALTYQDKALSDFDAYVNEGNYEDLAIQDDDEAIRLNPRVELQQSRPRLHGPAPVRPRAQGL
jgi:tetratricopeptide (TPR) repeat protein